MTYGVKDLIGELKAARSAAERDGLRAAALVEVVSRIDPETATPRQVAVLKEKCGWAATNTGALASTVVELVGMMLQVLEKAELEGES